MVHDGGLIGKQFCIVLSLIEDTQVKPGLQQEVNKLHVAYVFAHDIVLTYSTESKAVSMIHWL